MHWASILTALVLAVVAAWLVFFRQWQPWAALGVVGVAAIGLITVLALGLFAVAPRRVRRLLLEEILQTMRNDLRGMISIIRFWK